MIDKQLLSKRFSKQAFSYDEYAFTQKQMAEHLISQLVDGSGSHLHILEIGCGTGYLTTLLLEKFPNAQITAMDLASGMIEVAKSNCEGRNVSFICADVENYIFTETYDLIISNATFQWFNAFEETYIHLLDALNPGGTLAFSTFGNRTFYELHHSYELALQQLARKKESELGQSFYQRETLQNLIFTNDLLVHVEDLEITVHFPTVRDFFQSLKKIGANNSNGASYMKSPIVFRKLMKQYETNYANAQGVPATYHCLFAIVEKASN